MLKKKFPQRPIDANNDILGHILGHELQHVIRRHTLNSVVFQEAVKDASRPLDASVLTHVTRLHEIDADRQGMVMAFLAGYHPRGGIEFMEVMGGEDEIPKHLDHPTFEERVEYLTEYWTNDVRYAFVSFKLGVAATDRAGKLEATDMKGAVAAYEEAVEDFADKNPDMTVTVLRFANGLGPRMEADPWLRDTFLRGIPAGRFGKADDIKGLAVLLASDAAEWITGAAIPMDGGNLAMNGGGGLLAPIMQRYGASPTPK